MNDETQCVAMTTQSSLDAVSSSIDLTLIWGEIDNIICRLIRASKPSVLEHMEAEMARTSSACQAS